MSGGSSAFRKLKKGLIFPAGSACRTFAGRIQPVELFRKNLISDDTRSTSLTLVLSEDADRHAVIEAVNQLLEKQSQGLVTYQIGIPLVSDELSSLTKKDFCRLPPISMMLFAVILFVLYRHINCVLVPLLCVIVALIWTFGLMSICKIPLSMLTMMVPIFLLAIGIAYCLHICSEYLAVSRTHRGPVEAVRLTFSTIAFPTFLTVFTTIIGFASTVDQPDHGDPGVCVFLLFRHAQYSRRFYLPCFRQCCPCCRRRSLLPQPV